MKNPVVKKFWQKDQNLCYVEVSGVDNKGLDKGGSTGISNTYCPNNALSRVYIALREMSRKVC